MGSVAKECWSKFYAKPIQITALRTSMGSPSQFRCHIGAKGVLFIIGASFSLDPFVLESDYHVRER